MRYDTLTPDQQAQAAYLFADVHFGTNPMDYEYEVDGQGNMRRLPLSQSARSRRKPRVGVSISVVQVPPFQSEDLLHRHFATQVAQRMLTSTEVMENAK